MSDKVKLRVNIDNILQKVSNLVTSWDSTPSNSKYPSEKLVKDSLDGKQATLVSGTNLKTVNNQSLLGSGNITINSTSGNENLEVVDYYYDSTTDELVIDTGALNMGNILDTIYPIGSIYISTNSTSPATLFGGTWQRIEDKFLLASGTSYSNGSTGGSADAVVVEHTHTQNAHSHTLDNSKKYVVATNNAYAEGVKRLATRDNTAGYYLRSDYASSITVYTNTANTTATNQTTGESGTGKNMPPYLAVYVWERIADP